MMNPFTNEELPATVNNQNEQETATEVTLAGLKDPKMLMVCTIDTSSPEAKKMMYNKVMNPDNNLKDCVNIPIPLVDIYAEVVELENGSKAPRIVLFAADGTTYACVSFGVLHALEKLFALFGEPHYDTPITLIPKLYKTKKGQTMGFEIA